MLAVKMYYINQNPDQALRDTDLALDELEALVGRFRRNSCRVGQLRGKVLLDGRGGCEIRHHFTGKLIWTNKEEI